MVYITELRESLFDGRLIYEKIAVALIGAEQNKCYVVFCRFNESSYGGGIDDDLNSPEENYRSPTGTLLHTLVYLCSFRSLILAVFLLWYYINDRTQDVFMIWSPSTASTVT